MGNNIPDNDFLEQASIGRGLTNSYFYCDPLPVQPVLNPPLTSVNKIVFDVSAPMQQFNSKIIRMSNNDVDVIELIAYIVDNINRRNMSGETIAAQFVSLRTGDDAVILQDCVVHLYYGLFKILDPWLSQPNIQIIFNDYDYQNMDLHCSIC